MGSDYPVGAPRLETGESSVPDAARLWYNRPTEEPFYPAPDKSIVLKAQNMAMTRRRKVMILALALYWPTLFVLAHIPIPQVVREADMSDKGLHFLMYAILTFLLWSVIRPRVKVDWRRASGWLVLLAVLAYAVCDEGLQHFVAGRSADPKDLVADMSGAIATLAVFSVCSFWPAGAIISAMAIYMLPVLARKDLMSLLPVMTSVFYVGGYAFFTLLWMRCCYPLMRVRNNSYGRFLVSVSGPLALLLVTKISAAVKQRPFETWDMVAATVGILGGVLAAHVSGWPCPEQFREATAAPADAQLPRNGL